MRIRPYHDSDWPAVWRIFQEVVAAGDSYAYDPGWSADEARGRGVGRALGEYALAWAREQGYAAMQFNAVVEANHAAVRLWQALGFTIVGTVPAAFAHPTLGRVGLHVMHRYL